MNPINVLIALARAIPFGLFFLLAINGAFAYALPKMISADFSEWENSIFIFSLFISVLATGSNFFTEYTKLKYEER